MNPKLAYLLDSVKKRAGNWNSTCPYCRSPLAGAQIVDRKYVVTTLVRCSKCELLVRTPTDSAVESNEFYQGEYEQGYTTDCPDDDELTRLLATNFEGSPNDYTRYIRFFDHLGIAKGCRVLDFGSSWGYGLHQFHKAGYPSQGFEVSVPRARYGREKLNLDLVSSLEQLKGPFDVVFSSHVLEHLPDFSVMQELLGKLLSPGGYFIAVTPNGSQSYQKKNFASFHQLWGKVHPVLLNDSFVRKNFNSSLVHLDSWDSTEPAFNTTGAMDKWELVFVLKKS